MIYYPLPLQEQEVMRGRCRISGDLNVASRLSRSVLSLPIHTEMTEEEQAYIIESIKKDVVFYGSLETLENAIKGGRINALAGKLINVLNFKVIVKIGNGEVKPCDKARGDNNSMKKVVENVCDSIQEGEVKSLAIAHANCLDKALKVKEMMLKNHDFESVMISDLGSVMGTYTSKGAILISVL